MPSLNGLETHVLNCKWHLLILLIDICGFIITNYDYGESIYKLFMYCYKTTIHIQNSSIWCKSLILK
jgi:hypothetical protein